MTGHTACGRSLNGSPASIEASSITQTPFSGEACLPLRRRTVWWLTIVDVMAAPFDVLAAAVGPWTGPAERGPSPCRDAHSSPRAAAMEGQLLEADTGARSIGGRAPPRRS